MGRSGYGCEQVDWNAIGHELDHAHRPGHRRVSTPPKVCGFVIGAETHRSLVVSFKTNNSYLRWWEGRNIWSNITSNSRQLAMIIWLQVSISPTSSLTLISCV